jgi:hypothetical protein
MDRKIYNINGHYPNVDNSFTVEGANIGYLSPKHIHSGPFGYNLNELTNVDLIPAKINDLTEFTLLRYADVNHSHPEYVQSFSINNNGQENFINATNIPLIFDSNFTTVLNNGTFEVSYTSTYTGIPITAVKDQNTRNTFYATVFTFDNSYSNTKHVQELNFEYIPEA